MQRRSSAALGAFAFLCALACNKDDDASPSRAFLYVGGDGNITWYSMTSSGIVQRAHSALMNSNTDGSRFG